MVSDATKTLLFVVITAVLGIALALWFFSNTSNWDEIAILYISNLPNLITG